nr:hypothetical protein [Tanacetum cinerariifolium]
MLKALLPKKEKLLELENTLLNEHCTAVILKKLPKKLGDPGKFLIPYGFSELKCKALADLANQAICTPAGIARDVFVLVGKFTFPTDFSLLIMRVILEFPLSWEFADELALITFPPRNDDLLFDIESDLKEIEYLLHHEPIKDMDSILKDSVDKDNHVDLNDNLVYTMPEMFTDEHALDYSTPPLYDKYDDDIFEDKSSDFLLSPEYDSFLFEDFSDADAFPLTNNEDKVFNPDILIQENLSKVITRVAPNKYVKKLAISRAFLILEDFDPPLFELPFFKEVFGFESLLSFSFENEKKVFKLRILTSKGIQSSLLSKLSHQGYKVFKIIKILESPMKIFPFSYGEDIHILDVPCLHFYPP